MMFQAKLLETMRNYYKLLDKNSTSTSRRNTHTHYELIYIILYYILLESSIFLFSKFLNNLVLVLVDSNILNILEES